jgi:magnesium-transporting ATPase (P-type)
LEALGGEKIIEKALLVSFDHGIAGTPEDIMERDRVFGNNHKFIVEPKSYYTLVMMALEDFTMRVLLVAATVSIIIEVAVASEDKRTTAWVEGFAILVAVAVCTNVTAINDYQKERQF